jgi:glycosyltransferase involved in cell wall biosynthesis
VLTEDDLQALPLRNVRMQRAPGFGADPRVFDPQRFTPRDRCQKRRSLGIPESALVFIYIGRQTQFKGFPETARAALAVCTQRDDVHFVLVGTADPRHPDGLEAEERARLLNQERIHLIGWDDDVAGLLNASDCLVFPSAREGMAVSIMEALSMGVPVVTTSARGCGELVQHGHNGWIVPKDAAAVTAQLQEICQQRDQLHQRAATALNERDNVSRELYIDEQLAIYQALVPNPPT